MPLLTLVAAIANAGAHTFQAMGWPVLTVLIHWISDSLAYNVYSQVFCHVLSWWYSSKEEIQSKTDQNNQGLLSAKKSSSATSINNQNKKESEENKK